ncbi:hypothetical protein CCYA_CCYA08G2260 [Cyanidiococcus yangmingshanensis]|nr:hypothetical protein CCYA_CCYA08G2260 [Cyanidiococcus yangmingshanensis]
MDLSGPKPTPSLRLRKSKEPDQRSNGKEAPVAWASPRATSPELVQYLSSRRDWYRVPYAASAGGVGFTDRAELERQRHVVRDMLRQVGSSFIEGKDLVNVSLPIRLFEPRSFLQRLTDDWAYCSTLLKAAATATDTLERLKYTIAFAIAGLHKSATMFKPFNPLLGETFQAYMPSDGTRIYLEQTCHHPPVTHWRIRSSDGSYEFTGFGAYSARVQLFENAIRAQRLGVNVVSFLDGSRIVFWLPYMKIHGIVFGERRLEYLGKAVFVYEPPRHQAAPDAPTRASLSDGENTERRRSSETFVEPERALVAVMLLNSEKAGFFGTLRGVARGFGRMFGGRNTGAGANSKNPATESRMVGSSSGKPATGSAATAASGRLIPTDVFRGIIASVDAPQSPTAAYIASGESSASPGEADAPREPPLRPHRRKRITRRQVKQLLADFGARNGPIASTPWSSVDWRSADESERSMGLERAANAPPTNNGTETFSQRPSLSSSSISSSRLDLSRDGSRRLRSRAALDPVVLSSFEGTYLGFVDFDGQRYWDIRDMAGETPLPVPSSEALPSDSRYREDALALASALQPGLSEREQSARMMQAQAAKDRLENIQRTDRAYRERGKRERGSRDAHPFVPERILREDTCYWP